jgi:hypothetical protein
LSGAVTKGAGNAIAGVVTGIGFIGGALVFSGRGGSTPGYGGDRGGRHPDQ